MHIFQEGVHGLSLAKPLTANGKPEMVDTRAAQWVSLCLGWLEMQFSSESLTVRK